MLLVVLFGIIGVVVHHVSENKFITPDQVDKISLSVIAVSVVSLIGSLAEIAPCPTYTT